MFGTLCGRVAAVTAIFAACGFGGTIVSDVYSAGTSGSSGGLYFTSWTQTGSFTNVAIGANLATDNGLSTSTGTAYLMDAIGPGTTAANEVASPFAITVTGNPGINTMTALFTGLSLGPGTYYLVIDPSSFNQVDSLFWDETSPPLQTLGAGVTQNSDEQVNGTPNSFPPASSFVDKSNSLIFSVTGDPVATSGVPEPASVLLTLGGLAIFGAGARVRR